jgi:hypothetical protein
MHERSSSAQNQFVNSPSFPVPGLASPALEPAVLAGMSWGSDSYRRWADSSITHSEGVGEVSLAYGTRDAPSGPFVKVSTSLIGDYGHQLNSLESELARERDWLHDHGVKDEADPFGSPVRQAGVVLIDDVALVAETCSHGHLWAARAKLPPEDGDANHTRPVVTVVARGISAEAVRLSWVEDLRPYAQERRIKDDEDYARAMALEAQARAKFSEDLDVHQALIESILKQQLQMDAAEAAGRRSVGRSPEEEAHQNALWRAAIEAQSRNRSQDANTALAAVMAMVSHMRELSQVAPWFQTEAGLRDAAIKETVGYTAQGDLVDSQQAQDAWAAHHGRLDSRPAVWGSLQDPDLDELRGPALVRELRDRVTGEQNRSRTDRDRWLWEWDRWAVRRGS